MNTQKLVCSLQAVEQLRSLRALEQLAREMAHGGLLYFLVVYGMYQGRDGHKYTLFSGKIFTFIR